MNCNSNTAPLITNEVSGCTNGCMPKAINVVCREIIIPAGQETLGVEGDINSIYREFFIPIETEQGFNLEDATFVILVMNSAGECYQNVIDDNDKSIVGNYIKIKWNLSARDTSVNGNLKVAIQAIKDDFKWETYEATFIIHSSLSSIIRIQPPVLLQEKVVEPSNKEQVVLPDTGYDGLSRVIVLPVENGGSLTLDDVFDSITTSNSLIKTVQPSKSMDISGEEVENRALTNQEINNILNK